MNTAFLKRALAFAGFLTAAALLSGCASTWQVNADVKTFSSLPAIPAGAAYRYERLPSQQSYGEQQAKLEALVDQSFAKVGLKRDDAAAKYSVQIGARAQRESSPWEETWGGFGLPGRDFTVTGSGRVVWIAPFAPPDMPWFRREVSVVMRDLSNGQVVYESRAVHDGRWADSGLILPAMFDSALSDFPKGTQGVKRVETTVQLR